jgi:uncharacterized membrane protein YozB (DUF420 family)
MSLAMARVVFWAMALGIMSVAVWHAARGVRLIRERQIERHRHEMNRAVAWVLVFLALYLGKVLVLGHEDLGQWSPPRKLVIDIHRSFVMTMLVAGTVARVLGPRAARGGGGLRRTHRLFGRLAFPTAVAGLLTAVIVLGQMVAALR